MKKILYFAFATATLATASCSNSTTRENATSTDHSSRDITSDSSNGKAIHANYIKKDTSGLANSDSANMKMDTVSK